MNKKRTICLWIVNVIYYIGALIGIAILSVKKAIFFGMAGLILMISIILLKRREPLSAEQEQLPRFELPGVFTANMELSSTNAVSELKILITKQEFIIGRAPDCDCMIDANISDQVSRHHARIRYDAGEGAYKVFPYKTKNGTRLNGKLLNPGQEYVIKRGDFLEIANIGFRVESAYH